MDGWFCSAPLCSTGGVGGDAVLVLGPDLLSRTCTWPEIWCTLLTCAMVGPVALSLRIEKFMEIAASLAVIVLESFAERRHD